MTSSASGAADRIVRRKFWSAARNLGGSCARYSSTCGGAGVRAGATLLESARGSLRVSTQTWRVTSRDQGRLFTAPDRIPIPERRRTLSRASLNHYGPRPNRCDVGNSPIVFGDAGHPVDVLAAAARLRGHVVRTPLIRAPPFPGLGDAAVYLKLENFQTTGAFKIRGAINRIAQIPEDDARRGVAAASAGNHAQGVAWAARERGIPATIVMPETASPLKITRTQSLGARVLLHGANYDEAHEYALQLAARERLTYVHPYDDPRRHLRPRHRRPRDPRGPTDGTPGNRGGGGWGAFCRESRPASIRRAVPPR